MRIITTPMCEDLLKIANVKKYEVVSPDNIRDADIAVLLSETKTIIPSISVKLNTYSQIKDAVYLIQKRFNTSVDEDFIKVIDEHISDNDDKKDKRQYTKVKVYSKFLQDTIKDMGYTITDTDYDYVVVPDFMTDNMEITDNTIIVPSHKNVTKNIIDRINTRYELLENKLCMKQ